MRHGGWFCSALAVLGLIHGGAAHGAAYRGSAKGAEFFHETILRTFHLELDTNALSRLRQSPREYVSGDVREGDQRLTNVAVRLRGHGSFRTVDDRPNFALRFNGSVRGQNYRGLSKLMLNGATQDETKFADFVSAQLFRQAGVPAPRVTHARVILNGRDLGLYVAIEAMNRDFLKREFGDATGNLYEAPLTDIDVPLEQDNGTGDQADRVKLFEVCMMTNATERWRELPRVLDVERFISFAAMEMLTTHWDGYVLHTNNYRIYNDPRASRFVFIPHGMDWTFLRPDLSLQAPRKAHVAHAVLNTPEGEELYWKRLGDLLGNVFTTNRIGQIVSQQLARIRTGFSSEEMIGIEHGGNLLLDRASRRIARAAHELAGNVPVFLSFDTNGVARLTNWRADRDGGTGMVDRVTMDGRPALHITAAGPHYHPSWRSLVFLPPGSYRYEGNVKIATTSSATVLLRLSGPTTVTTHEGATPRPTGGCSRTTLRSTT